MGKVILFSAAGGTDPISNSNCQDGALLHICRVYQPDKIYVYMSNYALSCEKLDNRYTYCLEKLYARTSKKLDYELIERPELEEVQDFDAFYDDYKKVIKTIMNTMEEGDTLYLNASSGTPAMKSTLVVLATLGDVDGILLQVTTPDKKINKHVHDNYDVKMLWELNPDNSEGFVNRCSIVNCQSIVRMKHEEMLKQLINSYDYSAALSMAGNMNSEETKNYVHYLEYADYRMQLDYDSLNKLSIKYGLKSFIPIATGKYRNAVEYALSLIIKSERGDYADFVRGLTPLILELFILILEKHTRINARDFCYKDKYSGGYRWDVGKIKKNSKTTEWLNIWNEEYKEGFKEGNYLQAIHLLFVIKKYCSTDIVNHSELLRNVEENVRNSAAHEIGPVTADTIKKISGSSCDKIIKSIKALFNYSGVVSDTRVWDSYRDMNSYIVSAISQINR